MKKPKRFKKCVAGKWEQPIMKNYLMQCCDCSLVHRMQFRVVEGHVQFRAWRAETHTKQQRKKYGITVGPTKP